MPKVLIDYILALAKKRGGPMGIAAIAAAAALAIVFSLVIYKGKDNPVEDVAEEVIEQDLGLPQGSVKVGNESKKN